MPAGTDLLVVVEFEVVGAQDLVVAAEYSDSDSLDAVVPGAVGLFVVAAGLSDVADVVLFEVAVGLHAVVVSALHLADDVMLEDQQEVVLGVALLLLAVMSDYWAVSGTHLVDTLVIGLHFH